MTIIEVLSVRRTVLPASPRGARTKKVAMTIQAESGGTVLNIPYAPRNVQHTDLIVEYVTVPRPGLIDNVVYSNVQRPRMSMELEVHDKRIMPNGTGGVTYTRALTVIQTLQNLARKGARVRIAYGSMESGLWYIIKMDVDSTHRDPLTDEIIGAKVSLDFLRGDSAIAGIGTGPVSGGVSIPAKPPSSTTTALKNAAKSAARYYVVKRGDTLYGISIKYYKTGTRWTRIADANKIKDPRKLKIGLKLRIP